MKIAKDKLPKLNDRKGSQPVLVGLAPDALKDSGVAFANYGLNEGDRIEFPENWDDCEIMAQSTQRNNPASPKAYYVGVLRNDKESLLSLGSLRRMDKDGKYACTFSESIAKNFADDKERMESLFGKTIKCTGMKKRMVYKFVGGDRTDETQERNFPIIEQV